MTFDQIETFLTVADQGSFKAASEVLHRSQPALSVAVKKLEEELGIKLFDREQYRPTLTSQGRAFYRKSKDFYLQGKSLERFGQQLGMGEEPEISMAIDSLIPLQYLTKTFRDFSREHPDTRLNLSFDVLGGSLEKLEKGLVQLAISPQMDSFPAEMVYEKIGEVTLIPVLSASAKGQMDGQLTLQRMKELPQIIVRDTSTQPKETFHGILEGVRQWSVQDMHTKKEIILSGLGWGRLPDHLVVEEIKKGELVEVSVSNVKRATVEVFLVANSHRPMGPLGQKIWGLLQGKKLPKVVEGI